MSNSQDYTRREVLGTLGAAIATSAVIGVPTEATAEESSQVRRWLVVKYRVAWNYTSGVGEVGLYLQNSPTMIKLKVTSLEHFSGYLAILKESPVYYDSRAWLYTGAEDIG